MRELTIDEELNELRKMLIELGKEIDALKKEIKNIKQWGRS